MNKTVRFEDGLINKGNNVRYKNIVNRADKGETIKLAFIGGSITQGCAAKDIKGSYSYLVYKWWCERFKDAPHEYINAGVGGTTSQYAVARVNEEILTYNPDIVFVEFSVNDDNSDFYMETYESLIRRIYYHNKDVQIVLIHSIKYDDGFSSEQVHLKVGKYYSLPSISMRPVLYDGIINGQYAMEDITGDGLHPNDFGHELMSRVIINSLLEFEKGEGENESSLLTEKAYTKAGFTDSVCLKNKYSDVVMSGFVRDNSEKNYCFDHFKGGFIGGKKGDYIEFNVTTDYIAIMYRKTINRPAPVARAVIDNDKELILDGNFMEDWGDELHLDTVLMDEEIKKHKIKIEIINDENVISDFYLLSVICNKKGL